MDKKNRVEIYLLNIKDKPEEYELKKRILKKSPDSTIKKKC